MREFVEGREEAATDGRQWEDANNALLAPFSGWET